MKDTHVILSEYYKYYCIEDDVKHNTFRWMLPFIDIIPTIEYEVKEIHTVITNKD